MAENQISYNAICLFTWNIINLLALFFKNRNKRSSRCPKPRRPKQGSPSWRHPFAIFYVKKTFLALIFSFIKRFRPGLFFFKQNFRKKQVEYKFSSTICLIPIYCEYRFYCISEILQFILKEKTNPCQLLF